ncbi:MAG: methyltransferase [Candidatus Acidiferrum sp.]
MPSTAPAQPPQPADQLMQFAMGYIAASAVYSAASLGIPDLLKDGPRPITVLTAACGANEGALYRVLRALASVGVFNEISPRVFALTPMSELLRSDSEGSLRAMVLWMGNKMHFDTYSEMVHAIKTGETVTEKVYGASCFAYMEKNKDVSDVFNAAMTTFSRTLTPRVLEVYDFSWLDGKTLVDIGGGQGMLLTSILKQHPRVHGVVFDLGHVLDGAEARIKEAGLSSRCTTCGGDFFVSVPAADAYIMKHIIHDWNDERAISILKNCHRAGKGKARVILVESVLAPGNEPHFAKWVDLEMLMLPGGRERTAEEFGALFEKAGMRLIRIIPTKSPVCVLEAERVA